jgi:hypothetical protein
MIVKGVDNGLCYDKSMVTNHIEGVIKDESDAAELSLQPQPNGMNNMKNLIKFLEYSVDHPNYRLGQAFCNFFNITDAELFYEPDEQQCWDIIYKKYSQYID